MWGVGGTACLLLVGCSERLLIDEAGLVVDTDGTVDTDSVPEDDGSPVDDDDGDPTDANRLDVGTCVPGVDGCPCPVGQQPTGDGCVVVGEVELLSVTALNFSTLAGGVAGAPAVQVLVGGAPAAGVTINFATSGLGGSFTETTQAVSDAEGFATSGAWTLGKFDGDYILTASAAGADNVTFTGTTISDFEITLNYLSAATPSQEQAFDLARRRWQGAIVNALMPLPGDRATFASQCGAQWPSEPAEITGVEIFVELAEIDGPGGPNGNVLGQAGPCVLRSGGSPAVGTMRFDVFDLGELEAEGSLETVILHEMGHVLGVGTLWPERGLLRDPSVPNNAGVDTHFIGPIARATFDQLLMGGLYFGEVVPVENDASIGSADGHWRESVFDDELMSPRLGGFGRVAPLSILTIGSLEDHNYYVTNMLAADPYGLPFVLEGESPPRDEEGWRRTDELLAPRWQVVDGQVLAIEP